VLPDDLIEGLDLCGDGVAVPVVRFLTEQILEPLLASRSSVISPPARRVPTTAYDSHASDSPPIL
jgi:hypothetical protein